MPIYEFYCEACNTLFNFFSRNINTSKTPQCPKCQFHPLTRQMSAFAFTGKAREDGGMDDLPFDGNKMEMAMQMLAGEAENADENNPRQAADLMRKLTDITGIELGSGMEEALRRMEKGEDPEQIEAEMGDILETEDPFLLPDKKRKGSSAGKKQPFRDNTLYDL